MLSYKPSHYKCSVQIWKKIFPFANKLTSKNAATQQQTKKSKKTPNQIYDYKLLFKYKWIRLSEDEIYIYVLSL